MLSGLLLIFFITSLCLLIHTFFLYPLTLSFVMGRTTDPNPLKKTPTTALIIAAYNEEEVIEDKIQNSLELEYPTDKLNIVVFSDASDDATDEIVKRYEDHGVTLIRIEGRVGKTECQNHVAELVDEEILVFSDANSMYESDAIDELVKSFRPDVGCVVGELRYRETSDVEGESIYWKYESWIKRLESKTYSLITGNGSIYAVRSDSYVPQPPDAISDFTVPLSILRNGQLVKYAPTATAWEETESDSKAERSRRIRIVTRSWNSIVRYPDLLNLFSNPRIAYRLWSHKILRWLSPMFLTLVAISNVGLVLLTTNEVYTLLLAGQFGFYSLASFGYLSEKGYLKSRTLTHAPFYFVQANYGMLRGLFNFLIGSNIVVWETSGRK